MGAALVLVTLGASTGRAAGTRVVGVIAGVEQNAPQTLKVAVTAPTYRVEIRTNGKFPSPVMRKTKAAQTLGIHTDDQTAFTKWITHAPWQQDARATSASLAAGQCVQVELRPEHGDVADLVSINMDQAGSEFDPCKAMR
jgi:hypothetical protein